MKTVAITGPPASGKSTLWRAITGGEAKGEIGTVAVPDPRLDQLVELHSSRKRVPAQIQVVDVHAAERTQASAMARLREMDALLVVLPAFGGVDPSKSLTEIEDDLLLADMQPLETRLSRAKKDPASRGEVPALEKAMSTLGEGRWLSEERWESDELRVLAALAPVTLKPVMAVINVEESALGSSHLELKVPSIVCCAPLEVELAEVQGAEKQELLSAYGLEESVVDQVIMLVYGLLDLITFFTASDRESRAWQVHRGATAPEAAGVIHSDIQRGFIRAEVTTLEEVIASGSFDDVKKTGKMRVEGKDYLVKEGDVVYFRFAV